jgi:uncharacterized protein (TIRG00374 family)
VPTSAAPPATLNGHVPTSVLRPAAPPFDAPEHDFQTGVRRRRRWSWLIQLALVGVALGSIALFRDRLPDIAAMWRAVTHANVAWLAVVITAEAASMGTFARLQRRLLLIGGVRMSIGRAVAVTYAGNALSTTLPAGPAVSIVFTFRQWRRGGASTQVATAVIILGGIATTAAYSAIGMLALLAEPHSRGVTAAGLAALAAAAIVTTFLWRRPRSRTLLLRAVRGVLVRGLRNRYTRPLVRGLTQGLRQARGVVRFTRGDIGAITAFSLLNWLFDILALVAAARALGVQVPLYALAVTYFAAQAAGSLFPLLPGGLGAIEGSMTAALVAFGAGVVPAGAAVGLYRIVSYWAVVSIGWLAWLILWIGEETRRAARLRWRSRLVSVAWHAGHGLFAIAGVATPCLAPNVPTAPASVPPPVPPVPSPPVPSPPVPSPPVPSPPVPSPPVPSPPVPSPAVQGPAARPVEPA